MGINMASGRIEDQSAAFNIFSFFSGINDFLHFGNADVLSEYFDSKNEFSYLTGADPAVQNTARQITKHMQKISLGAQMSDSKPSQVSMIFYTSVMQMYYRNTLTVKMSFHI